MMKDERLLLECLDSSPGLGRAFTAFGRLLTIKLYGCVYDGFLDAIIHPPWVAESVESLMKFERAWINSVRTLY